MKKRAVLVLLAGMILCSAEELSISEGLPGWLIASKTAKIGKNVVFDPEVKVSKSGSIKFTSAAAAMKRFKLEPGAEYEVSYYVKADQTDRALLWLNDGKKYLLVPADGSKTMKGTFDWRKCTRTIKSSFFGKDMINVVPTMTGNGTAWFDNIRIEKKTADANKSFRKSLSSAVSEAALIPGGTFGFFDPGQDVSFRFLVRSSAKKLEYAATVKDENGKTVFSIPRKPFEERFKIPGQDAGYYIVEADIYADGVKAYYTQSAFAVNRPVMKRDPFFQLGHGVYPDLIPGYKRIGVGSIVMKHKWMGKPYMLKCTPEQMWKQLYSEYKKFLEAQDFDLSISVGPGFSKDFRTPEQVKAGWPLASDQVWKAVMECVGIMHKNTRNRVRAWNIQVEIPSVAHSKQYCNTWTEAMFNMMIFARMVSRKLKSTDPEIKVFAGGNNRQEYTETVERMVMSDLANDIDGYMIDGYTGNWNMTLGGHVIPELRLLDFYRMASDLSVSLGKGKEIQNAETGYAINYGASFDRGLAVEQADLTARTIILTRSAPVTRFELHMPVYYWAAFKKPKDNLMALVTVWKPVYFKDTFHNIPQPGGAMYATATAELSFAKALDRLKNCNVYSCLFTKPDGSVLITLWNIAENGKFLCDFPKGTTAVNLYGRSIDPMALTIGPAPVYITVRMPPEKAVAMMKNALSRNVPEFKCAASGDKVYIRSFAPVTKTAKLCFPGQPEQSVKLLPSMVNEFPMQVKNSGKLLAQDGRSYDIPLQKQETQVVQKTKGKPVFDGSGKWLEKLPSGTLKYPDHIRPAEALQPERQYFRTSFNPNGHNISAQYWTAYDDEYFYFAVKVDDPVHQQRKDPLKLWQDDSIQFVLSHESGSSLLADPAAGKLVSEYNFGLALTPKGTVLVKYAGKDSGIKDFPAKVTRNGNTTFYEAAIPWKAVKGRALRFGFVVTNNNWPTVKTAPYRLEFCSGIMGGPDDTKLKVLKFEK